MTKYGKTKKLVKELGITKEEAINLLRRSGYDLGKARDIYETEKAFNGIDFHIAISAIEDGLKVLTETIDKAVKSIREMIEDGRLFDILKKTEEKINE